MSSRRYPRSSSVMSSSTDLGPALSGGVAGGGAALAGQFGELTLDLVRSATGQSDATAIHKFTWCNKALSVRALPRAAPRPSHFRTACKHSQRCSAASRPFARTAWHGETTRRKSHRNTAAAPLAPQSIRGLDACRHLRELDLSCNAIAAISGLGALTALRKLSLAHNRIAHITGLDALLCLEHLLLQGNRVATLAAAGLPALAALPALRSLYLQSSTSKEVPLPRRVPALRSVWAGAAGSLCGANGGALVVQANPVCARPGYKQAVLAELPNLQNLDGDREPHGSRLPAPGGEPAGGRGRSERYEAAFAFEPPRRWLLPERFEVPRESAAVQGAREFAAALRGVQSRFEVCGAAFGTCMRAPQPGLVATPTVTTPI